MLPNIETNRLFLRPLTRDDESFVIQTSCNANVMRFITGKPRSLEEARAELERNLALNDGVHGMFTAFQKSNNNYVGFFLVRKLENSDETEIGYRIAEDQWKKGFATEGANAVLSYIFEKLKLRSVVAVVEPANSGSLQVLKNIGFTFVKKAKFYGADLFLFRIITKEFAGNPNSSVIIS